MGLGRGFPIPSVSEVLTSGHGLVVDEEEDDPDAAEAGEAQEATGGAVPGRPDMARDRIKTARILPVSVKKHSSGETYI